MKYLKKTILIKATSSVGKSMVHNAEFHTLLYFCKWLAKDHNIVLSGVESESQLVNELRSIGVVIRKPFIRYLFLNKIKKIIHIPVAFLNTFVDAFLLKPDLIMCLGGVFYNGIGVVMVGKILKIKTLVRSAEDHIGLARSQKSFNLFKIYLILRAILSRYAIQKSNYFLTVGNWSLNYFRDVYNLDHKKSFMIPGPVDYSICYENHEKANLIIKDNLINEKKITNDEKLILFIGSNIFKGINETFKLAECIKKENISANIIWISQSKKIKKKVIDLGLDNYVNVITPMDRKDLIILLKNVDFLFWSTPLGVGYGQIMIESILCDTEIICYSPIGDAKEIVKENYYYTFNEIIKRIKGEIKAKKYKLPKSMECKLLEEKHRQIINKILYQDVF